MLRFIGLAASVLLLTATAAAQMALPAMAPAADEIPITGDGGDATDALLNCYEKFSGPVPDPAKIGPPRLTISPSQGPILRTDFPAPGAGVDRLTCWAGGFIIRKDLALPPLYPPGTREPDPATAKAIAGWKARRDAEAHRRATARRLPPPDADTIARLEGIWLIGRKPDQGNCLSHWYRDTQIEFEFRKSGGRALTYQPYDLFTAVPISGIEKTGEEWEVQGHDPRGGLSPYLRFRMPAEDRLELLPPPGRDGETTTAYRCGDPDRSVNESMSPEDLAAIVPPTTFGGGFPAAVPGVADADVCQGKAPPSLDRKALLLEIYGPAHYWIFGMGFKPKHRFAFDFIRAIRRTDDRTIRLDMQEHLEGGDGWDVEQSRGRRYTLTLIDKGGRWEIPELATEFVKCKPGDHVTMGVYHW